MSNLEALIVSTSFKHRAFYFTVQLTMRLIHDLLTTLWPSHALHIRLQFKRITIPSTFVRYCGYCRRH